MLEESNLSDILQFLTALGAFITLFLGYLQYKRTVRENQDKSFREIVKGLSSENKQNRLASASNLGTFIKSGNLYYNEAVDILVNIVAIETNLDVLQAVRSSLEKISPNDYRKVIQKLLKLEQNIFNYESYSNEKFRAYQEFNDTDLDKIKSVIKEYDQKTDASYDIQLEIYRNHYLESMARMRATELVKNENPFRKELIANFIVSLLALARNTPISGLELYQNSWNYVLLSDLKLPQIVIEKCAMSSANIGGCEFRQAKIAETTFFNSSITNTDLSGSEIKTSLFDNLSSLQGAKFTGATLNDVFFTGSNLKGADFREAKGLQPEYFYGCLNTDQAMFDPEFKQLLLERLEHIDDKTIKDYVMKSQLPEYRRDSLFSTLDEI